MAKEIEIPEGYEAKIENNKVIFVPKESEDERITRAINNMLPFIPDEAYANNGVTKEGVLNWLEKQKEQKHPDGCFTCDEYKKGYEEGRRNGFTAGYNKAMKEVEQKEQKPVKIHNPTDKELEAHHKQLHDFKVFAAKQAREHHISFVHDFEWEAFCGELLSYFNEQQKPAEWSEEDEDMLNSCISSIEEAKENRYAYKETDGDTSYDHEIAWLKSLRPSWKPSEEQMEILQYVCTQSSHPNQKVIPVLESLYNDLKKL